uniref:Uncharacterized protein n=1 Tax=Romanomermis culicivorax TaxID=13658 RepID=A0A915JVR2_ROMCU
MFAKGSIASIESFVDSLSDAIQQIQDTSKVGESVSILVQNEADVKVELRDSECQIDRMPDDPPRVSKTVSTSVNSDLEFKPEVRDIGFQTEANEAVVHEENQVEEVAQLSDCFGKQKCSISRNIAELNNIDFDSSLDDLF